MSYSGIKAKIPLGEFGLMTDVAPDKAPPNTLIQATNIVFHNGAIEKAPGSYQWNSSALAAGIVGVHYYLPTLVQPRFIAVTSNGSIYKGRDRQFGNPINQSIASVLTPNVVFADGGQEQPGNPRKCFIFTGGATLPYVITGDAQTAHQISLPSSDWTSASTYPVFGLVHRSQMWAFGGQISYASNALNHEDFQNITTTLINPVYPGEGGQILSGGVYKGRLFCFKDGGFVYGLVDTDPSEDNWYWQKVASNFSVSSPNGCKEVLDDFIAANNYGTLTSFQATFSLGNVAAADLVQQNKFETYLRNYLSKSGIAVAHLLYYPEKKQLFLTCRGSYQTANDTMLMIDFGRFVEGGNLRPAIWQKGSPQCLGLWKDINNVDRPMYGDAAGFLNIMDWGPRQEGTASYTGAFQIQHLDFSFIDPSLSSATKHFEFIALHYIPTTGSSQLSCDYYIDGKYVDTVSFSLSQYTPPQLGSFQLGVSRLAAGNEETALVPIHGSGRTLSAYFYNSALNANFRVPAITVYFRPGGDEAQAATS